MKVLIDGLTRDMTAEEEAAFRRDHENLPPEPEELSLAAKAEAYDILMGVTP